MIIKHSCRVDSLRNYQTSADADITTKKLDKLNFKYVKNDIICDKNGEYVSDAVHFDYNAGSAIVDLGSTRQLSSLKVFGKNTRISPEYLEIWLSEDGIEWNQLTTVSWQNDTEGLKASFAGDKEKSEPTARYVKLHSLWDERDQDYAPVDKSTFHGNLWNLFEISFIASGKENSYTYDARGNRLIENEKYGGNSNLTSTEYFYYANSDLIKKAGTWYFNYDKNGNLITKGTSATAKSSISSDDSFAAWSFSETSGELWTYEYDLQNRMIKASYSDKGRANLKERSSYVYDYRGLLVNKTYQDYVPSNYVQVEGNQASKSVTEYYEYSPNGKLLYTENSASASTNYIWANQTLWCEINEGVVYYHHTDHLGTTEVVTDTSGKMVWSADYEAFGNVLSERGDSSFTPSFTVKFFDKSSGLYYFNARWYDSELGRFTTQDPARDGVNWWNYCNSSPVDHVDPDGNAVIKKNPLQESDKNKYVVRSQNFFEIALFDKVQPASYPIFGETLTKLQYKMAGEYKIQENKKTSFSSILLSGISLVGDLKISNFLEKAGNVTSIFSWISVGNDIVNTYLNELKPIALEDLTCSLFNQEISSSSIQISEKLYLLANKRLSDLEYISKLHIDFDYLGIVENYSFDDPLDLELIRNELNNYKLELLYGVNNE